MKKGPEGGGGGGGGATLALLVASLRSQSRGEEPEQTNTNSIHAKTLDSFEAT
jgi:hypothetical protein